MRIGVIGAGGMGATHVASWQALSEQYSDVTLAAVADIRPEFLKKAGETAPGAKLYAEGADLLENEPLDAVDIVLPSYLHTDMAVKAMDKGLPVLLEKPVCLTEAECDRLLEAQKRNGVPVMGAHVVRFFDEYRYLKKLYDEGTLGRLKSITMQRISGTVRWGFENWFHEEDKSGSVVLDLHIHDLDFLRCMIGEPDELSVRATAYDTGMINHVVTDYGYKALPGRNIAPGFFAATEGVWDVSAAVPFEASFHAYFEKGALTFRGNDPEPLTLYGADGSVSHPLSGADEDGIAADRDSNPGGINISGLGYYYKEIKYFAQCLREGKEPSEATLADGAASVRLARKEFALAKEYIRRFEA